MRWATAFFITRADFTTCGRNILPDPNRSPTTFMPSISGPSITSIGRGLSRRAATPLRFGLLARRVGAEIFLGERHETLRSIITSVENHILTGVAQLRIDRVVDVELAGIDDRHVEPGRDRMVEKDAVHRPADRLVAAEGEA